MPHYDAGELVRSLIGAPFTEIRERLEGAAGLHESLLGKKQKERDLYTGTREYSQFAKAALNFLFYSDGREPAGIVRSEFLRLHPLIDDMVARGIANPAVVAWHQQNST